MRRVAVVRQRHIVEARAKLREERVDRLKQRVTAVLWLEAAPVWAVGIRRVREVERDSARHMPRKARQYGSHTEFAHARDDGQLKCVLGVKPGSS